MGFLFSKPKAQKKSKRRDDALTEEEEAVLELKQAKRKIEKYVAKLDKAIVKDVETAKKLLRLKKKQQAKLCLVKKKQHEKHQEGAYGKISNLDKMLMDIEMAKFNKETFEAMKQGTSALQKLNNELTIEDVEQLMEDNEEAMAYANEINDILADLDGVTDEDVMAELLEMEEMEADELNMALPDVPTNVVRPQTNVESEEEEEVVEEDKKKTKEKKVAMVI